MTQKNLAALLASITLVLPLAKAQSVDQLLPPETLFVVSVDDFAAYSQSLESMPLSKIMGEAEMLAFLEKPKAALNEGLAMLQQQIQSQEGFENFELSLEDLTKGTYGRMFVALTHIAMPDPQAGRNVPDIGLVIGCESKDGAPDWQTLLKDLIARAAGSSGMEVGFSPVTKGGLSYEELTGDDEERPPILMAKVGDMELFSLSHQTLAGVMNRAAGAQGESLHSNGNYAKAQRQLGVDGGGAVRVYVSVDSGLRVLTEGIKLGMSMEGEDQYLPLVDRIVDMSGLRALKSIASVGRSLDGVAHNRSFVGIEGELKGLLALSPENPITFDHLAMIPKTAGSFNIFQFDVSALYDLIMDVVKEVDEGAHQEAMGAVQGIGQMLGGPDNPVDLRNDLLGNIGPQYMFIQAQSTNPMMPALMLMAEVRNPETVMGTLKGALEFAAEQTGGEIKVRTSTYKDAEIVQVDVAGGEIPVPVSPCFSAYKGYLMISLSTGDLKRHIRFLEKGGSDIRENEDFQRFFSKIPQDAHLTQLSYSDIKGTVESGYGQVVMMLPMLTMAIDQELPVDMALMPTSDTITQHLYGSLSYGLKTEDGAIMEGFSPIGGEVVGIVAGAAVMGGVVAFSTVAGMEAASPMAPAPVATSPNDQARSDLNNLKSGITVYKLQNGHVPATLDELLLPTDTFPTGYLSETSLPIDPWGNAYFYTGSDKAYKIWSAGPNGADEGGAGDDIAVSRS